jgi:outer membrane protein assembly factor BamB
MRRSLFFLLPLLALAVGTLYGGWAFQRVHFPFDGSVPGLEGRALRSTEARFRPAGRPANLATSVENAAQLGYLDGSEVASEQAGVVLHDAEAAWQGLNLCISGHGEEATLLDMAGEVLHRWQYDLRAEIPAEQAATLRARFRRAHLGTDGSLIAVYGGHSWLVKLDKDSKLLWKKEDGFHHDLEVRPDGKIYAIASKGHVIERIHPKRPVIEDYIVILSGEGEELARQSILEAFENSDYAPLLALMPAFGDIQHTNSIEVLGEPHPDAPASWRAGQVLISIREMDTIAVVDLSEQRVVWAATGRWDGQHQATVLENGHLLLFDNYGTGMSRIMEFAPNTVDLVWDYPGNADNGFFSETCGSNQRLPNGNTLITESDSGRAFEVNANGEQLWRFVSPHRAGEQLELVATLFDLMRYPLDYLEPGVLAQK